MQCGRDFAHEHPATATSWSLPEVEAISSGRGVSCIVNDACMFGLKAIGKDGREGPARKPTRWMTNAPELVRHLARKCNGTHAEHVHLLSGRAARAAIYPPALVEAIIQGLQVQREADHRAGRAACPVGHEIEQAMKPNIEEIKMMMDIKVVHDEYTGEPLDEALVHKAKNEELKFFKSKGVWRIVPRASAQNQRVVGTM